MAIVNTHYGFCAKGGAAVKFTYTGEYNVRDDGVVELLTSGTIVFLEPKVIDLFMVGGGGAGRSDPPSTAYNGYGGGGGGYTRTIKRLSINANEQFPVTIGAGGNYTTTAGAGNGGPGGASAFNTFTVNGGVAGSSSDGGAGGSGGGAGVTSSSDYGSGGSDGNNGEKGNDTGTKRGGVGQRFTTREFGETTGKLYAGGGGGGRYISAQNPVVSSGGAGGGGSGAWINADGTNAQAAAAGVANTGGGGGGGARTGTGPTMNVNGASGGSGIVCFREAQELPELAGTWVLNERLYNPEANITGQFNFTTGPDTGTEYPYEGIEVPASTTGTMTYLRGTSAQNIYNFSTNTWYSNWRKIIISAGATASDEFRAWLASNATKQS